MEQWAGRAHSVEQIDTVVRGVRYGLVLVGIDVVTCASQAG